MPQIVAYEDIGPERVIQNRGNDEDHPSADVYPFIGSPKDESQANAFLVRYIPGTVSSTHFHEADQMQIIVEGRGKLGHHALTPYQVHFSRAFTPYGPLLPDANEGWAFVNLRTRPDPHGAQRLSRSRDKLLQTSGRRPFQTTCSVTFPDAGQDAALAPIPGLSNDEGLRGLALTLPPHGRTTAPSPADGDGQYVVVVQGSLVVDGRERKALAIAHVAPNEPALELQAGAEGLQAMIVDFPRIDTPVAQPEVEAEAKMWKCVLCDFIYDESQGMPDEGIAAGTKWEDVPEDWSCPDCGATKADFVLLEF